MNVSVKQQVEEIVERVIKEKVQAQTNPKRNAFIVANWKMNMSLEKTVQFLNGFQSNVNKNNVVICPPFPLLYPMNIALKSNPGIQLGAQNVHSKDNGAHTGEVSTEMLQEVGCRYVIIGHSERRIAGESDDEIHQKVERVLQKGMYPIVCIGENEKEFKQGRTDQVVKRQVEAALKNIADISNVIIAYEPVWAIGTGRSATPDQAEAVHQKIRQVIQHVHGSVAQTIPILYGGSVNAGNANSLAAYENIDGVLVGGASLEANSFQSIIRSFDKEL